MIVDIPSCPSLVSPTVEPGDMPMVVSEFRHEVSPKRLMCGNLDPRLMNSVIESIDLLMDAEFDGIIEMVKVKLG